MMPPMYDLPPLHQAADRLSGRAQRRYMWSIAVALVAAALAAFAIDVELWVERLHAPLAVLTVVLLVVGFVSELLGGRVRLDQRWFQARAVAESVKTAAWRYAMGAPPFEGVEAEEELGRTLRRIRDDNVAVAADLDRAAGEAVAVTPSMRAARAEAWETRRRIFIAHRLEDQIGWYGGKSVRNGQMARRLRWATLGVQLVAIGLAVARIGDPRLNFVGTATTVLAGMIAWSQAKRFADLATSYRATHDELAQIGAGIERAPDEAAFLGAVAEAENAISREHTMWVAKSRAGAR